MRAVDASLLTQASENWVLADQAVAIEQEVPRWNCDVVALQEVASQETMVSLEDRYRFLGARKSHCGFVHLYLVKDLEFSDVRRDGEGVLVCKVLVGSSAEESGKELKVAAVHPPSGMAKAPVRSRVLSRLAQGAQESSVLILGFLVIRIAKMKKSWRFAKGSNCGRLFILAVLGASGATCSTRAASIKVLG